MSETKNIVVLGASFGGISAAHYTCRHILPKLKQAKGSKYELHIVDPSTHFWHHIAAPREICSVQEMKHNDVFFKIADGFKQYTELQGAIHFHHASATALDTQSRTVSIKTHEGSDETLQYYALVIGTGIRSPTPLTTLQGDHTISQRALEEVNSQLATAKEIVVSGGGPVGVEVAGELGAHFGSKASITLYAGGNKLLPILRQSLAEKAQSQLEKVGVKVVYGVKVQSTSQTSDGKTSIQLDNGSSVSADVYIPGAGVTPNTEFLPAALKRDNGYVVTNKATLRVDAAGPRVYAVGDVAGVDQGGVLALHGSLPVAGSNMAADLLKEAGLSGVAERSYDAKEVETQFVPVGPKQGVGAFSGWQVPSFVVSMAKGKDYLKGGIPKMTEGTQWAKA